MNRIHPFCVSISIDGLKFIHLKQRVKQKGGKIERVRTTLNRLLIAPLNK